MKLKSLRPFASTLLLTATAFTANLLEAGTFTWTNTAGGGFGTTANWNAAPTFATDDVLDFSTLNITANATTTLDANRTAGTLKFADATTASHDWNVNTGTAGNLTLATTTGTPEINASNRTVTFGAFVAGSQGFNKTGGGTAVLNNAANTVTGTMVVTGGLLQVRDGTTNTPTVFNNLTGKDITVKTGATLDLPRLHASTTQNVTWTLPSLSLEGGSTLRFRATTGSNTHTLGSNISNTGSTTINNNGGAFSQNMSLTGIISGTGTINYLASSASGSSTTVRTLTVSNTSTSFSGNWFVDYTASTTDDFVALQSNAAGSLGTGTVTLDDRARLVSNLAGSLNSLAGVTLQKSTATLTLNQFAWSNSAAALTINGGAVTFGNGTNPGSASIGNLSGTSGSIITIGTATTASSLTVNQTSDGTFSGTIAPNIDTSFNFTKTGASRLTLASTSPFSGVVNLCSTMAPSRLETEPPPSPPPTSHRSPKAGATSTSISTQPARTFSASIRITPTRAAALLSRSTVCLISSIPISWSITAER